MDEETNSKWIWLERTKKVVEIFAILIAGLWALKLYRETDVPAKEKRPSIQSELQWTNKSMEGCLAEYTVTFKNVGKTPINLGRPTLSVWSASQPKPNESLEYLDPHKIMSGEPRLKKELTNQEFADHFPPDVGDTVTMTTLVKRNPGQIMMFELDFPQSDPQASHFLDYRWGYACDEHITQSTKGNKH